MPQVHVLSTGRRPPQKRAVLKESRIAASMRTSPRPIPEHSRKSMANMPDKERLSVVSLAESRRIG